MSVFQTPTLIFAMLYSTHAYAIVYSQERIQGGGGGRGPGPPLGVHVSSGSLLGVISWLGGRF